MTGQAWLGDVARAAVALDASSAADWRHIAACLGLGAPRPTGPRPEPRATPETHPRRRRPLGRGERRPRPAGHPAPAPGQRAPGRTIALTPVEHRPPAATGWTVDPLPPPAAAAHRTALAHDPSSPPDHRRRPARRPGPQHLRRRARRGSGRRPGLRLRPLTELPRRPVFTLRYGVQILADVSASMEPLARDVTDVVARVRALAGVAGTRTLYFSESAARRGRGPRAQWRPYRVPPAGTTVLILSSLGLTGPVFNPTGPHRGVARHRAGDPRPRLPARGAGARARTPLAALAARHAPRRRLGPRHHRRPGAGNRAMSGAADRELAVLLSTATRIEPELMRAVRLTAAPRLDVAAETELWFGDLVERRASGHIVLRRDLLPELRQELARQLATAREDAPSTASAPSSTRPTAPAHPRCTPRRGPSGTPCGAARAANGSSRRRCSPPCAPWWTSTATASPAGSRAPGDGCPRPCGR
ncbi:hypothetical protein [Streptomyces griseocarneus]|uniref:VWA domain-containing protein n=1 Tax=Streptomyces griseocarneus TaxID=51201 RepID=A0ABX7RPI5_9ACTN|nr:hypothetical protein [Streptomyces griseocarneus]QSY49702.1 hypothetical protein J3S04_00795 [Streptomyces griseocarneus]